MWCTKNQSDWMCGSCQKSAISSDSGCSRILPDISEYFRSFISRLVISETLPLNDQFAVMAPTTSQNTPSSPRSLIITAVVVATLVVLIAALATGLVLAVRHVAYWSRVRDWWGRLRISHQAVQRDRPRESLHLPIQTPPPPPTPPSTPHPTSPIPIPPSSISRTSFDTFGFPEQVRPWR
jgi:hypothetical protein